MEAETERGMGAAMNEADIEYLRNINTRPGPNAGRSINPTKRNGPDADAALAQSDEPLAFARMTSPIRIKNGGPAIRRGAGRVAVSRARWRMADV
jgi:hypothetical protein